MFEFYLDAFRELSTARPSGLDLQSIPFTAIVEYFRIYGEGDLQEFHWIIRSMDDLLLDLERASRASEGNKDAAGNRDQTNRSKGRRK